MANRSCLLLLIFVISAVIMAGCQASSLAAPTPAADEQPAASLPIITAPTPKAEELDVETQTATGPVLGDRVVRAKDEMEMVFVPRGFFLMGSGEFVSHGVKPQLTASGHV